MNRTRNSRQLGLALACAHLAVAGMLTMAIASSYSGVGFQDLAARGILFLLDLPVSVVGWFLILWFIPDVSIRSLPFPVSDLQGFLAPAILHCGVGTLFYYFLPVIFGRSEVVDEAA